MSIGRIGTMLAGIVLVSGAMMAQTTTTSSTLTRQTSTPPIGLGSTETAQINVTNLATASSSGTAASCTGSVSFVNAGGTTIGSATNFTVASGQTSSVSLPFNKAGASGTRTEIRGIVTRTQTTGSGAAPCSLSSSLEIYDTSTGATHAYFVIDEAGANVGGFGH